MPQPQIVDTAVFVKDAQRAGQVYNALIGALGENVTQTYPGFPADVSVDRETNGRGVTAQVLKFGILFKADGSFLGELPGGGNPVPFPVTIATAVEWLEAEASVRIVYPEGFFITNNATAYLVTDNGIALVLGSVTDTGTALRCDNLNPENNGLTGSIVVVSTSGVSLMYPGVTTAAIQGQPQS